MTAEEEALAQAHIEAERRLRLAVAVAAVAAWDQLPSYDRADVPNFLRLIVPIIEAGKRQSIALTRAYLARAIERPVTPVDQRAILAGIRNGTPTETVYTRPFIGVWSDLKAHKPFEDAVSAARGRVDASAQADVQLAMTHTLRAVGLAEPTILGYARVPDPDACAFCKLVAGQRYRTDQLAPIHNRCGCGIAVVTAVNRDRYSGNPANDLSVPGAAVHAHGELGPVLGDPDHAFLTETEALAR